MNKLSALALGTALTLSLPLAALAQDAGAGVTLDGGVNTELGGADNDTGAGAGAGADIGVDAGAGAAGSDVEAGANGQVGAQAGAGAGGAGATGSYTYGDLDDALQGAASADLSMVTTETEIEVVDIADLTDEGEFTAQSFDESRTTYQGDIDTLRSNIEGNSEIVAELEAQGFSPDDVIAVWMEDETSLTIFVDGQQSPEAGAAQDSGLTTQGGDTGTTGGAGAGAGAGAGGDAGAGAGAGGADAGAGAGADTDAGAGATTTQ